ncbi:MAG: VOC family protein [Prolixibacteraceae bacterium]|nr:VOC family protein [Prolixibacteraceae bacterium]MBN2649636.1 VOC family protein [Prolixibacteraceae bacterium]
MLNKPKFICPLLVVADMQRARSFYETVLEQKVIMDFGENITFEGNFALHLQSHFAQLIDGKKIDHGANNFEIYFEFDDMEAFNQRLLDNGVELVHPMLEQPWRQRVVRFYDPDRHIIEVGESMEHLCYRLHNEEKTIAEIEKITMMPCEFVKSSVESYSLLDAE